VKRLTVPQVAEFLGISTDSVYQLVADRKIEFLRVGPGRGKIQFRPEAVTDYLDRCTIPAKAQGVTQPPKARPNWRKDLIAASTPDNVSN
jgi:excisionase family DNA binding protein